MENNIDEMTSVISKFMIKVTQMELSPSDELRVSGFFHTNIDNVILLLQHYHTGSDRLFGCLTFCLFGHPTFYIDSVFVLC
mgnify:CR=1 FL=1